MVFPILLGFLAIMCLSCYILSYVGMGRAFGFATVFVALIPAYVVDVHTDEQAAYHERIFVAMCMLDEKMFDGTPPCPR